MRIVDKIGLLAALSAVACTSADNVATSDSALDESPRPRKGSTISSPNVDPSKTYWGARTIKFLEGVNALTPEEARLAVRADGIIANSPPNGRLGVDELAALESPAHIDTLYAGERAMLPKLWKLLEVAEVPSYKPAELGKGTVTSEPRVARFQMPIARLPSSLQGVAKRIQLSRNDDADELTISGRDMLGAYEDRGSYLPTEASLFDDLGYEIAKARPGLPSGMPSYDLANQLETFVTFEGGKVTSYLDRPTIATWIPADGTPPERAMTLDQFIWVEGDAPSRIISFDVETGVDSASEKLHIIRDRKTRVEVWKGGVRIAEIEGEGRRTSRTIPFGHTVKSSGVSAFFSCRWPGRSECSYRQEFEVTPEPLPVPATSYGFTLGGEYRLDLFPSGYAVVVAGAQRAVCYPSFSLGRISGCKVSTQPGGIAPMTITFSRSEGDPSLGDVSSGGGQVPLYAF